jgi:hypothetical protein
MASLSLTLSGLPKELRLQAASGDSTQTALSGYTQDRTISLINDCFGTPQTLPSDVEMVRHTFIIGGGKNVRGKYSSDLPKHITAALRDIGYSEDKGADISALSAGTFKRQHDTGANLIYCHVFPTVVPKPAGGGEQKGNGNDNEANDSAVGLSDMVSRPMNLCIHAEMPTFRSMVEIEVKRWCQKKNLLDGMVELVKKHQKITEKLVNREALNDSEQRVFELDAEDLKDKATWLKTIMKQQVGKKDLTDWDLARMILQLDEKLANAPEDKKLLQRKAMLESTPPRPLSFKGRDQLLPLYVKLFDIQKSAGTSASVKQLTAIKATEDLIGPLESGSKGWFENDECVVKRLDQLKARARKMKPAQQKKKGGKSASGSRSGRTNGGRARKVGTGAGGWSTVAKSKGGGNRFSAFD